MLQVLPNLTLPLDEEFANIMFKLNLSHLIERESETNSFGATTEERFDLENSLSPGEKQRLSFGRVLFFKPEFVRMFLIPF